MKRPKAVISSVLSLSIALFTNPTFAVETFDDFTTVSNSCVVLGVSSNPKPGNFGGNRWNQLETKITSNDNLSGDSSCITTANGFVSTSTAVFAQATQQLIYSNSDSSTADFSNIAQLMLDVQPYNQGNFRFTLVDANSDIKEFNVFLSLGGGALNHIDINIQSAANDVDLTQIAELILSYNTNSIFGDGSTWSNFQFTETTNNNQVNISGTASLAGLGALSMGASTVIKRRALAAAIALVSEALAMAFAGAGATSYVVSLLPAPPDAIGRASYQDMQVAP